MNWRTALIDTDSLSDKDEEKAATLFAGAFLMPREHLLREVGKHRNALGYNELIDLKRLYRVSGAALLMRLRQLDVISESTLVYAFQTIARGWRTQEPEELETDQPYAASGSAPAASSGCAIAPLRKGLDFAIARPPNFCGFLSLRSRLV